MLISLDCGAAPPVAMYTVWATTGDVRAGHRRTDVERIADGPALLRRLTELAPLLAPPAATMEEGATTMVLAPDPALSPGAGRDMLG